MCIENNTHAAKKIGFTAGNMVQIDEKVGKTADMIVASEKVVVFTGAGISTESGIPDFRSPGGIWSRFDPEDFTIERYMSSAEARRKQWRSLMKGSFIKTGVEPNKAHYAIVELEKMGKLDCVITQNVDNLHQKAGIDSGKVYELHGNMQWVKCMNCGARSPLQEMILKYGSEKDMPACERCQGILKPDAVFFGEALPADVLDGATQHATSCDLLIVIGSSLVVYPAAYIPMYAKDSGAKVVIITISATPFDRSADVVINESAGFVMERIIEEVRKRL